MAGCRGRNRGLKDPPRASWSHSIISKAPVKGLRVFDVIFWSHGEALIRKQKDLQNSATEPVYLKPVFRLDPYIRCAGRLNSPLSF